MMTNQLVSFSLVETTPRVTSAAWWAGSPAALPAGVTAIGQAFLGDDGLAIAPGVNRVRGEADLADYNKHGGGSYKGGTAAAWGSGDVDVRTAAAWRGISRWELASDQPHKGLAITAETATAEVAAETAIWIVVHGFELTGTGDSLRLGLVNAATEWAAWEFNPAAGTAGDAITGDTPADIALPASPSDWEIVELEAGVYRVAAKFTVPAGQTLAAGWFATFGPGRDRDIETIIFTKPMVFVGETPPDFWVPPGAQPSDHVEIADPGANGFSTAPGSVLRLTAKRPPNDGTLVEIVGDNANGAGHAIVRLNIAGGAPQIWVSDDGGTSSRTGTAAAADWSDASAADIAVEVRKDEAVLFIDDYAVTGAVFTTRPTAITAYRIGAEAGGANGTGTRVEAASVADRADPSWSRGIRKLTTAEVASYDLPGRLVVEI